MPSTKRQLSVRAEDETHARLAGLVQRVSEALGVPVSQADVVRLALIELEKKYPQPAEPKKGKGK